MAKAKKMKSQAQVQVPQTKAEASAFIRQIGDTQREFDAAAAEMNGMIAAITEEYGAKTAPLAEKLLLLQQGVQAYCEAHRDELTDGGRVKTANLITGDVSWRTRPPSVTLTKVEAVIAALKAGKLVKFLRTKTEVNKEAILANQKAVAAIPGIKINKGIEDFVIEPFGQEVKP